MRAFRMLRDLACDGEEVAGGADVALGVQDAGEVAIAEADIDRMTEGPGEREALLGLLTGAGERVRIVEELAEADMQETCGGAGPVAVGGVLAQRGFGELAGLAKIPPPYVATARGR